MDMEHKTILVTGATDGIGKATALGLAKQGAHTIVVGRNQTKGEATIAEIKRVSGNAKVDLLVTDFASLAQVRQLATEINTRYARLDVLINNAGVFAGERSESAEGFELMFAVNHLAPFLLTNLLLGLLKRSAPARIITVSSGAQAFGTIDFDDLNAKRSFGAQRRYGQSKLANVLFTYELARRLAGTGVTANVLEPGFVATNMPGTIPGLGGLLVQLARPMMRTPEQGAQTSIYLASSPELTNVSGKFFDAKQVERRSSRQSYDQAAAQRLWRESERLTGLADAEAPATLGLAQSILAN